MGRALWMDAAGIPVKVKKRKPVRKVSKRQAERLKCYRILKRDYMHWNPNCECCKSALAVDLHHRKGRCGDNFFRHFIAVCRSCHDRFRDEPKWAMENGWILPRNTK